MYKLSYVGQVNPIINDYSGEDWERHACFFILINSVLKSKSFQNQIYTFAYLKLHKI